MDMTVSTLREKIPGSAAHSGGGMDRVVVSKKMPKQMQIAIAAAVALLAILIFYFMAPTANSRLSHSE